MDNGTYQQKKKNAKIKKQNKEEEEEAGILRPNSFFNDFPFFHIDEKIKNKTKKN